VRIILILFALSLISINANADTEATPIELDISSKSTMVKGYLTPNTRVSYSLTPGDTSDMVIQIQSSNNEVGFTVWDTGYHLAIPILGDSRKPLLGVIKEEMEEVYIPNITWQGQVINREHVIIIENYGEKESSFMLKIGVQ
jgi:hypothetical protein